ncbi:MAG: proline-rich domain-containing protein [Alphaproteobacteria bacterium]
MNVKLLLSGVALGLVLSLGACQKKQEAPPAPSGDQGGGSMQQPGTPEGGQPPAGGEQQPQTPPSGGGQPFGMQSGKVEYQVTGAETGTETLAWDSWGTRMAITTKATMGTTAMDKTTLVTMDKVVSLDNTAKTGTAMANPMKDIMAAGGTSDEMTGKMMGQMGATKQGTDTVLGKTCDKYVTATSSTCVWQGIALKTETTVNGATTTKVATKIEENAAVDPTSFDIPAGMTVQDMTSAMAPAADSTQPAPAQPEGH